MHAGNRRILCVMTLQYGSSDGKKQYISLGMPGNLVGAEAAKLAHDISVRLVVLCQYNLGGFLRSNHDFLIFSRDTSGKLLD